MAEQTQEPTNDEIAAEANESSEHPLQSPPAEAADATADQ